MRSHTLESTITLSRPLDEVFDFFADAGNLERITPPELRFRIETPLPIEMRAGSLIEYRLSLFRIPFSWLTEIAAWDPGQRFVDRQIRGPFQTWIHEHRFEAIDATTTRIMDKVEYALPLSPVGELAHFLVRGRLDRIFSYRETSVSRLLS